MQETWVRALGLENPLEEEMTTHPSILAGRIPWTGESCRLQSMQSQRIRCDWAHSHRCCIYVESYGICPFLSDLFHLTWCPLTLPFEGKGKTEKKLAAELHCWIPASTLYQKPTSPLNILVTWSIYSIYYLSTFVLIFSIIYMWKDDNWYPPFFSSNRIISLVYILSDYLIYK